MPAICNALHDEDLSELTFGRLDVNALQLAKTANRSVLGTMNDLAFHCELRVLSDGGIKEIDVHELNRAIRRIPMLWKARTQLSLLKPSSPTSSVPTLRTFTLCTELTATSRSRELCTTCGRQAISSTPGPDIGI